MHYEFSMFFFGLGRFVVKLGKKLKLHSEIQKYAQNDHSGVEKYTFESGKVGNPALSSHSTLKHRYVSFRC